MRRIFLAFLVFLFLSTTTLAPATTVVVVALPDKVAAADQIVEGRVVQKACYKNEQGLIYTRITIQNTQFLKGTGDSTYSFNVPGGKVGDMVLLIPGFPQFHVGEDAMLFLGKQSGNGLRVPVGFNQGKYRIQVDANTGEKTVLQEPFSDVTVVSPRTGLPTQAPASSSRNYDEFVRNLRQLIERGK